MCFNPLFYNDLLTIHDIDAFGQLSADHLAVDRFYATALQVVDTGIVFHHLHGTNQCGCIVLVDHPLGVKPYLPFIPGAAMGAKVPLKVASPLV